MVGSNNELNEFNSSMKYYADLLKDNPGLTILIEGHTSTPGSVDYNQNLSQERAEFIKTKILENLPNEGNSEQRDRILTEGYGETKPIHLIDDTNEKQQENRRIVINIQNNADY